MFMMMRRRRRTPNRLPRTTPQHSPSRQKPEPHHTRGRGHILWCRVAASQATPPPMVCPRPRPPPPLSQASRSRTQSLVIRVTVGVPRAFPPPQPGLSSQQTVTRHPRNCRLLFCNHCVIFVTVCRTTHCPLPTQMNIIAMMLTTMLMFMILMSSMTVRITILCCCHAFAFSSNGCAIAFVLTHVASWAKHTIRTHSP